MSVSTDGFESWNDAVRRAENGETVAVIAHGKHVADVVPSGELDRLRETIEVLSDPEAARASGRSTCRLKTRMETSGLTPGCVLYPQRRSRRHSCRIRRNREPRRP